jgi:hypothetical protein
MFCSFFSQCLGASAVKQNHGDTEAQRGLRPHPKFQISNSRSVGENDSSDGKSLRAAKKFTNSITAKPESSSKKLIPCAESLD